MTRTGRLQRRHARNAEPAHRRARDLAAERLDRPLEQSDEAWLAEHLTGCDACRAVASAYQDDQTALLGLRDIPIEPPRDLWARTAAAIEHQDRGRRGSRQTSGSAGSRSRPPLGILSGLAVVAVVVGASLISGGWLDAPATVVPTSAASSGVALASQVPAPGPTPILVGAGAVRWVGTSPDGALAYNVTDVNQVCVEEGQKDCAPLAGGDADPVNLIVKPKSISKSPIGNDAVVVGSNGSGSDTVYVIALPTAQTTAASPTPTPASTPKVTPTPTATIEPTPASTPSDVPTDSPATTASPSVDASPSTEPQPTPTEIVSTTEPPTEAPAPTRAANLAIATGVKVVGGSAAYSPDGQWFAFTARASDGSTGPDIYIWRVGDEMASALTNDHDSAFASWVDDRVVGSRAPGASPGSTDAVSPTTFLIDPATGQETASTMPLWRPVVGPHGRWAVGWDGTVTLDPDDSAVVPASGSLILMRFDQPDGVAGHQTIADGPIGDFDVRWDETGDWLAVWVADPVDPTLGRLTLFHLDQATGALERPKGAPQDVTALSGFSIGDGRLAWATPPGQEGEGSRVQIVAWTDDAVGVVESGPIEGVVLVH